MIYRCLVVLIITCLDISPSFAKNTSANDDDAKRLSDKSSTQTQDRNATQFQLILGPGPERALRLAPKSDDDDSDSDKNDGENNLYRSDNREKETPGTRREQPQASPRPHPQPSPVNRAPEPLTLGERKLDKPNPLSNPGERNIPTPTIPIVEPTEPDPPQVITPENTEAAPSTHIATDTETDANTYIEYPEVGNYQTLSGHAALLAQPPAVSAHVNSSTTNEHTDGTPNETADDIVVLSTSMPEAQQQMTLLHQLGLRVTQRKKLDALGWVFSVYRLPVDTDARAVSHLIKQRFPAIIAEPNWHYSTLSSAEKEQTTRSQFIGKKYYAQAQLGFTGSCTQALRIAMLDTGINKHIDALRHSNIRLIDAVPNNDKSHRHGTAIANLLVGKYGVLPCAQLVAVNVFVTRADGKSQSSVSKLLLGLNHIAALDPAPVVLNLSLGGPHSEILQQALAQLQKKMVLIAAVGNNGTVAYPAAYSSTVAVTAVDAKHKPYHQASHGSYIDIAAPGVDIWTINEKGRGFYASGSSFAAPFVSAVFAVNRQHVHQPREYLKRFSQDLGESGKDKVFGYGLLNPNTSEEK